MYSSGTISKVKTNIGQLVTKIRDKIVCARFKCSCIVGLQTLWNFMNKPISFLSIGGTPKVGRQLRERVSLQKRRRTENFEVSTPKA